MTNTRHRTRRSRIVALLAAGTLVVGGVTSVTLPSHAKSATTPFGNLAEALQKSLYFYDAEKSGAARTLERQPLEWRGDSEPSDAKIPLKTSKGAGPKASGSTAGTNLSESFMSSNKAILDPDGDGYIDLSGGFHDAGDHVKFGLPQSYTASTLAWGVYEFEDAFKKTGTYDHIMDELYWFNDYFLRSTFRNKAGDVVAFNYMVGNGTIDHTYWGPPELQDAETYPRPAAFGTADMPASDQASGAAAALTIMSLLTKSTNATYSAKCLDNAKALYAFAKKYRGTGFSDGFYNSSFDDDEMSWAAVWLYIATDTKSYLTDIVGTDSQGNYTGYLKKIIANPQSTWQNIWVHSWDTVWGGMFAKLATASKGVVSEEENKRYWYYFKWNLEYWTGGDVKHDDSKDSNFMASTPAGYQVVATWGSARYNTAAQLGALVYRKVAPDDPKGTKLTDWALGQMNYIMGDNPLKRSYIVGFGKQHVMHPHHRAAHGSTKNSMLEPADHRHTLWGALAGGPGSSDEHKDETTDYVYNEVAIDYNAGFVGALAGLYQYYGSGQTVTEWTPPAEAEEDPPYITAKVEQENNARTQVTMTINNYLTHPPHWETSLSARYYFNISEMTKAGQTISAVTADVYYDESKSSYGVAATLSKPQAYNAAKGIYYVEVSWKGASVYGKRDFQFGLIAAQDSSWKSNWDPTNDWSRDGLTKTGSTKTKKITVYRDGKKIFGDEPGTTPDTSASPDQSESPEPSESPIDEASCSVTYKTDNWSSGFTNVVTVTNTGSSVLNPWELTMTLGDGQTITSSWNAEIAGTSGAIAAKGPGWNTALAAGASTSFGYQGTLSGGSYTAPAAPTLNGTVCAIG